MVSVSLNYDAITFTHPRLLEANISYIDIAYSKNCGTVGAAKPLSTLIPDITVDGSLTVDVGDIITGATVFPDGVYNFKMQISGPTGTNVSNVTGPGTYTVNFCIYIGSTSRCKALAIYNDSDCKNEVIPLLLKALTNVDECDECDCSTMCDIYNYLQDLITDSTNTSNTNNNVYTDCGCS